MYPVFEDILISFKDELDKRQIILEKDSIQSYSTGLTDMKKESIRVLKEILRNI